MTDLLPSPASLVGYNVWWLSNLERADACCYLPAFSPNTYQTTVVGRYYGGPVVIPARHHFIRLPSDFSLYRHASHRSIRIH